MKLVAHVLGTGLYTGYVPIAPGTAGSLLGLLLYWAIPASDSIFLSLVIAGLFVAGVWAASRIEKETGIQDNGIIVIDEIVGMLITVFLLEKKVLWMVMAFLLFRFFDIVKLFPARSSERFPGGWGVMMDDVVAGIYSALSLRLLMQLVKYLS
ncbi:MAG: phosphatidylglycerophosphatase A [bacterium]